MAIDMKMATLKSGLKTIPLFEPLDVRRTTYRHRKPQALAIFKRQRAKEGKSQ